MKSQDFLLVSSLGIPDPAFLLSATIDKRSKPIHLNILITSLVARFFDSPCMMAQFVHHAIRGLSTAHWAKFKPKYLFATLGYVNFLEHQNLRFSAPALPHPISP